MIDIRVLEIKLLDNNCKNKNLKAIATVRIGEIVTYNWRIVKKEGERAWVQPPHTSWKGPDGIVRYQSLLSIPGELKKRIDTEILLDWEKEVLNEKGKESR